jgi:hypothetical protein
MSASHQNSLFISIWMSEAKPHAVAHDAVSLVTCESPNAGRRNGYRRELRDNSLDKRRRIGYITVISLTYQDAGRVTPSGGASAVPAGKGSSPWLSGGLGKTRPTGIMTGLRVQSR